MSGTPSDLSRDELLVFNALAKAQTILQDDPGVTLAGLLTSFERVPDAREAFMRRLWQAAVERRQFVVTRPPEDEEH